MNITEFSNKFAAQFEDADQITVSPDTKFRDLATWDSMTAMCIQTMILDDYGVILADQTFNQLTTLQEIFDFVVIAKNQ